LTLAGRVTYTRIVHRAVAILLGLLLASTSGQVGALHIHDYTDHDHPEHHHGLASHEHHRPDRHHDDDELSIESCDPGQHAVSITMGCVPWPAVHAPDGECASPDRVEPLVPLRLEQRLTDVRVHGPPPLALAPRAPPLSLHA
jgi:hypothetical protein